MEEKDLDHDTRLFISHDAPQQGANIPMGLQYMYRHMTNQYITASSTLFGGTILVPLLENNFGVSSYLSILDTPASRQMLKIWSDTGYGMNNTVHDNFYAELKGLNNNDGYPTETRNIAISNGSECGNTQNFYAGEHFLDFQHDRGWSFWGDMASLIYNPLGGIVGGLFLDPDFFRLTFLGMLPGSSQYIVDFQVKTISYQNGYQIYKGLVRYKKKILWVFDSQVTITNVQRNQPNNILPYDYYGGGFFDTGDIAQGLTDEYPDSFIGDHFGFIPTVSSLDIGAASIVLNDLDFKESYVGANPPSFPKNSPFDNFSTDFNPYNPQSQNYRHLAFNTRNGNWLAGELDRGQPLVNCSFSCNNLEINGPSIICSSPVVFSVPQGANSYSWQVQNSSVANLLSGTTGNSITLSQKGNNSGWITLKVSINGGDCGNATVSRQVYVGSPRVESIEEVSVAQTGHTVPLAPFGSCDDVGLKLNFAPSFTNVQNMEWEKVTTNYQWSQGMPGNSNEYVVITPTCNGPIKFKVRMKNSCGWSDWQELEHSVTHCSSNCQSNPPGGSIDSGTFVIWPVPATTVLNVKIKGEDPGLLKVGETLTIQIFNSIGVMVKNVNAIATQTAIDVSNLPSGTYTLVLTYNGVPESHQIVIG